MRQIDQEQRAGVASETDADIIRRMPARPAAGATERKGPDLLRSKRRHDGRADGRHVGPGVDECRPGAWAVCGTGESPRRADTQIDGDVEAAEVVARFGPAGMQVAPGAAEAVYVNAS